MIKLQGSIHDTIYGVLEIKENETSEQYFQRIDDFGYQLEASLLEENTQEKFGLSKSEAGRLSIVSNYIILKQVYEKQCLLSECPHRSTVTLAQPNHFA